ncbi:MAG: dihydrodipicolinate reductase C-terminal domain-containing protein [Candidatus Limnocylindrales bacterium]
MRTIIIGDGHLGWAIAAAASDRGERTPILGRPTMGRHDPVAFEGVDLVIDASRGDAVATNVRAALDGGVRRFVIATTGWAADRDALDGELRAHGAAAVVAANFSLGVNLFARLVEVATDLYGAIDGFDPYLVEWHRRAKADRPSGTALELAARIAARHPGLSGAGDLETVSIRAGSSPGMHLVGFDAAGETVELRLTARDRTAYGVGVLAATDWLRRAPRASGIHTFDPVVDELLARRAAAA